MLGAEALAAVKAKIAKAEEFLTMAEIANECGALDAATSLGVSSAINASDAIIIAAGGVMPSGQDHQQAVTVLRKASDEQTSRQLTRVLGLKHKAQYGLQRCTAADVADVLKAAERLLNKSKGFL